MDFVSICQFIQDALYFVVMFTGAVAVSAALLIPIWKLDSPRQKHKARHN